MPDNQEAKITQGSSGQEYDVKVVPDPILGGTTEQVQVATDDKGIVYTQDGG